MAYLVTNKKTITIDNEYPGDPGRTDFKMLGGYTSFSDYQSVLNYIIVLKIREYAKRYFNIIEVGYEGDFYFVEENLPETETDDIRIIKYLVNLYNEEIEVDSYDAFIQLPIWKVVFGFENDERLLEINESHQLMGDWGEDPKHLSQINVKTLELTTEEDCSDLVEKALGYRIVDDNEFLEYVDYEEIYEKVIIEDSLESLNDMRFFFFSLTKQLILKLKESGIPYPIEEEKELDTLRIDIQCSEIDHEVWGKREFFDIHDGYPFLKIAEAHGIDINQCASKATRLAIERRNERYDSVIKRYRNKRISTTGILSHRSKVYKLEEIVDYLNRVGATYVQDVDTSDLLIVGEKAGRKKEKALELNIEIMKFKAFIQDVEILVKAIKKDPDIKLGSA